MVQREVQEQKKTLKLQRHRQKVAQKVYYRKSSQCYEEKKPKANEREYPVLNNGNKESARAINKLT